MPRNTALTATERKMAIEASKASEDSTVQIAWGRGCIILDETTTNEYRILYLTPANLIRLWEIAGQ